VHCILNLSKTQLGIWLLFELDWNSTSKHSKIFRPETFQGLVDPVAKSWGKLSPRLLYLYFCFYFPRNLWWIKVNRITVHMHVICNNRPVYSVCKGLLMVMIQTRYQRYKWHLEMHALLVFLAAALLNSSQCDYTLYVRSAHRIFSVCSTLRGLAVALVALGD